MSDRESDRRSLDEKDAKKAVEFADSEVDEFGAKNIIAPLYAFYDVGFALAVGIRLMERRGDIARNENCDERRVLRKFEEVIPQNSWIKESMNLTAIYMKKLGLY